MKEKTQEIGLNEGDQNHAEKEGLTCTTVTSQYADVSVPLKLKPYANVGKLETECCGEPTITLKTGQLASCSCGCEIIIMQTICIKIPLEYGTDAQIGETVATCKKGSNWASRDANLVNR